MSNEEEGTNISPTERIIFTNVPNMSEWLSAFIDNLNCRQSSPLRAEEDSSEDSLGADYDPGRPGDAELWFRKLRREE